jgi:hypothetical protein
VRLARCAQRRRAPPEQLCWRRTRFVLQALLVGARRLHVTESVNDLGRRVDLLQLHLVDADAGGVKIEHLLHQLLHGLLGLLPRACQERLNV